MAVDFVPDGFELGAREGFEDGFWDFPLGLELGFREGCREGFEDGF